MKRSLTTLVFCILTFNLLTGTAVLASATTGQTGTLAILPGTELVFLRTPDNFNFDPTFIPASPGNVNIYKTLNPMTAEQILKIGDSTTAAGFSATMSMSDFTSSTPANKIHFDKVSFVTLHQSLTEHADGPSTNNPPGAPNVTAPEHCMWDPAGSTTMESACDNFMYTFTGPPGATTSGEMSILSNAGATDTGTYSIGFGLRLNLDSTVKPDTYSSTLTFTLIPL